MDGLVDWTTTLTEVRFIVITMTSRADNGSKGRKGIMLLKVGLRLQPAKGKSQD